MFKNIKMVLYLIILLIIFLIVGDLIYRLPNIKNKKIEEVYLQENISEYTILVEVDRKQLVLINNKTKEITKTYPIATGKPSSPTPLGTFKIIQKAQWGEGFGTRWLGLDVPWGTYGIHGTNKPGSIGRNLSAGCIRMRNKDVEELYKFVKTNTLVVITNGLYGPFGQGFRDLKPGDRGADVLEVQKRLKDKGYYNGELDGIYGEGLKAALIKFLKDMDQIPTDTITYNIYTMLDIILME